MITKFSALYVGPIELDDIGRDGTPADERRYSNERFAEAFWTARDVAQTMDELGYYCLWTAEHHFQREPSHDERYKWFAPFGFVRYADEHGRPWGTPGAPARVPTLAEGVAQKAWFIGRPERVVELIREVEAKYPALDQMMIHWAEGLSPKEFKEQLRWFARDVMPAFRRGR